MEVISSIIYHYLSIISNLDFHHSLKYYHFQSYIYMRVYTSTYLNYKFPGFSQIHRSNCRLNHWGIQTGISVQWHGLFTVRRANGLTDEYIHRQKLIYDHLPTLSSSISPFSSPSQLSSIANNQPSPPPKKKSPSSQHNKSYFLKFCGHSIRVLIYRWILSFFVSNSIFLNFNI